MMNIQYVCTRRETLQVKIHATRLPVVTGPSDLLRTALPRCTASEYPQSAESFV